LSGDGQSASRDAFRASKTKIPQARFAPACVAVDVALARGPTRLFVVFGGVTPAFDLADVAAWMDARDYSDAARASAAETEALDTPSIAPASDLD
jgi:hypothetical protein